MFKFECFRGPLALTCSRCPDVGAGHNRDYHWTRHVLIFKLALESLGIFKMFQCSNEHLKFHDRLQRCNTHAGQFTLEVETLEHLSACVFIRGQTRTSALLLT